jgi:hypothetical protein
MAYPGTGYGFGIVVFFSDIVIDSNIIYWNDGGQSDGGILLGFSKSTRIANNIIFQNGMYGVFCATVYETPDIVNCTLCGHDISGLNCAAGAWPVVTNTILWGNAQQIELGYTANPKVTYSDVQTRCRTSACSKSARAWTRPG